MPKINFVKADGGVIAAEVSVGTTILQAAEDNNIGLSGPCGGNLACGHCHVVIDEQWSDKLPKPEEAEESLLDMVWNAKPTSRMGCQVRITSELDGIVVHLPQQ
ncbi:MAG: 2Fe-2S iron-sulfur cluster binding domain-containing protein [Holosporales bacterium]|jgi:2Fe-2S ferredoxin|nr:2Fe-2S iron-sulfur cluster binding domain-containing protein [Holosporales bacterium]